MAVDLRTVLVGPLRPHHQLAGSRWPTSVVQLLPFEARISCSPSLRTANLTPFPSLVAKLPGAPAEPPSSSSASRPLGLGGDDGGESSSLIGFEVTLPLPLASSGS